MKWGLKLANKLIMPYLPRFVASLLAVLCLSVSMAFAKTEWVRARSDNFEFYGLCGRDDAITLLGHFEEIYHVYSEVFPRPESQSRILVIYCKEWSDYKPFLKHHDGKRVESTGMYMGPKDYPAIVMERGDGSLSTRRTINQTMAHAYMGFLAKDNPLFIQTGLAQLFDTITIHGDGFTYGRDQPGLVELLNRKGLLPMTELLAATTSSDIYNKGKQRDLFHAQCWAFAHMCLFGNEGTLKPKFLDYLHRQSDEPDRVRCLEQAFGKTLAEIEAMLTLYIKQGRYRLKTAVWTTPHSTQAFIVPFVQEDWDSFRSGVLQRVHPTEANTQAALTAYSKLEQSKNSLACAFAALHARDLRQRELSQVLFERARSLNSDHPRLVVDKVDSAFDSLPLSVSYRMPEELATQLRACVDEALELHPNHPELLRHLAYVEAFAPKLRIDKLERLERLSQRAGANPEITVLLAYIRWRHNDAKTAKLLLSKVGTPSDRFPARDLLAELDRQLSQGLAWKKVP